MGVPGREPAARSAEAWRSRDPRELWTSADPDPRARALVRGGDGKRGAAEGLDVPGSHAAHDYQVHTYGSATLMWPTRSCVRPGWPAGTSPRRGRGTHCGGEAPTRAGDRENRGAGALQLHGGVPCS